MRKILRNHWVVITTVMSALPSFFSPALPLLAQSVSPEVEGVWAGAVTLQPQNINQESSVKRYNLQLEISPGTPQAAATGNAPSGLNIRSRVGFSSGSLRDVGTVTTELDSSNKVRGFVLLQQPDCPGGLYIGDLTPDASGESLRGEMRCNPQPQSAADNGGRNGGQSDSRNYLGEIVLQRQSSSRPAASQPESDQNSSSPNPNSNSQQPADSVGDVIRQEVVPRALDRIFK
jgi:hypothetical protein